MTHIEQRYGDFGFQTWHGDQLAELKRTIDQLRLVGFGQPFLKKGTERGAVEHLVAFGIAHHDLSVADQVETVKMLASAIPARCAHQLIERYVYRSMLSASECVVEA